MGGKARGRLAMRGKEVPADLRAKLRDAVDEDTLGAVIVDTMQGGFHRERLDAVKLILAELAETKKARTLYLRLGTAGATTAPQPVPTATSASPEQCASASPTWSCSASATGCYRFHPRLMNPSRPRRIRSLSVRRERPGMSPDGGNG